MIFVNLRHSEPLILVQKGDLSRDFRDLTPKSGDFINFEELSFFSEEKSRKFKTLNLSEINKIEGSPKNYSRYSSHSKSPRDFRNPGCSFCIRGRKRVNFTLPAP